MKKRGISIIVLVIIAVIVTVIVVDFLNNRPSRLGKNPYAYNMDVYKQVDPELVHFKETRNISLSDRNAKGIDLFNGDLYLVGDGFLQVITSAGVQKMLLSIDGEPTCLKVNEERICIGYKSHLRSLDHKGTILADWDDLGERTVITSIALKDDKVYAADAGNRRVLIYNSEGELLDAFEGKATSDAGHGFIIPSANFDLVVNAYGELWVVNPGKHAIENYTDDGVMRGYWQKSTMNVEGFAGCCNPAEIAVTPEGWFVTSEKGLVRIKVYDASGKLRSVVAGPDKFKEEGKAPEIVVDEKGVVYALDFDKRMIRIFEPKEAV